MTVHEEMFHLNVKAHPFYLSLASELKASFPVGLFEGKKEKRAVNNIALKVLQERPQGHPILRHLILDEDCQTFRINVKKYDCYIPHQHFHIIDRQFQIPLQRALPVY